MKTKHLISAALALLLACSLPVTALAAEYDLAEGSVTVIATESGQTVTHGSNAAVPDDAPVIIQSNSETPTANTVTVKAEENAAANVTIQGVNIVKDDPCGTIVPSNAAVTVDVADGAEANITLSGVNIDMEKTGGGSFEDPATGETVPYYGEAAVQITGNGDVTIELDGENTLQSGWNRAGVEKNNGGSLTIMVIIIIWLSAIASAFVDNIPFAATMVPVITSLSATMGVDLHTLAWTLSMGTDIGGSATPIGASANVAGTAIAARDGHPISWGKYCKYSAPAAVIVIALSMVMILLRY